MRFGTVALFGRSNVGKSALMNALLGEKLAIVSPVPQTTRDALLGVVHLPDAQIGFLDTPGVHRPKSELDRRMNAVATDAARAADVALFMTDVAVLGRGGAERRAADEELLALLPAGTPCVLAVNKVDLLRDKSQLLPALVSYSTLRSFAAIIPLSVLERDGLDRLLSELTALLPEGEPGYDETMLTDKPTSFFVREYVREQVLLNVEREVPHAVAVVIDQIDETEKSFSVKATLWVDKVGQRKILVGRGGEKIRDIGISARKRIAELVGKNVHLELFVRVTPRWKNAPRKLSELGYEAPTAALPSEFEQVRPQRATRKSRGKKQR